MAAPKGNQFWKLRSKHGRDKLFSSAELLWESACEYFEWCDNNPWIKKEAIKSGDLAGRLINIPTQRPYTIHGLCSYLDCSTEYLRHFEENNLDSKDFMPVITRIREAVYQQKFEGATVGFFNANIIARDLGLIDKKENDVTTKGESIKTELSLNATQIKNIGLQMSKMNDNE